MVIPRFDPLHPEAPEPDRLFLDAICRYLDPRRLVTTEVFLRGPAYVDVWVSVGVEVEVGPRHRRGARGRARRRTPVPLAARPGRRRLVPRSSRCRSAPTPDAREPHGWPLGKAVQRLELVAVASRVPGVRLVSDVQLGGGTGAGRRAAGRSPGSSCRACAASPSAPSADLDARARASRRRRHPPTVVPVPVVPETC